jgi:hypothetical protein
LIGHPFSTKLDSRLRGNDDQNVQTIMRLLIVYAMQIPRDSCIILMYSRSPKFKKMLKRYKEIISLILLIFLCVFNLALPLPSQVEKDRACSKRCHCTNAMNSCCCCKREAQSRNRGTFPCIRPLGCMDDGVEGIVCHGLSHITILPGSGHSSVFLTAALHAHSYDGLQASVYSKAIDKPPRLS